MNNKTHSHQNIILHISHLNCDAVIDKMIYSKKEIKQIKFLLKNLSKDIWIDKTYVKFRKTRWKDAFIKESYWNKFCELVIKTNIGEYGSEYEDRYITELTCSIIDTYIYIMLCKYGYDINYINIFFKSKFLVEYEIDKRTKWNS